MVKKLQRLVSDKSVAQNIIDQDDNDHTEVQIENATMDQMVTMPHEVNETVNQTLEQENSDDRTVLPEGSDDA